MDFSKEIIRSVCTTRWYDSQSEGTREKYYYDIICAAPQKDILIKKIIKLLKRNRRDDWAIDQLFNLCAMFAKNGNAKAKQAIYNAYLTHKIEDVPWLGEEAIINMDGAKGLEFLKKQNKYDFIERFEEENKPQIKYAKKKKLTYKEVKLLIHSVPRRMVTPNIVKLVNNSMVRRIANDFVNEIKIKSKLQYIGFFRWIKFPYGYKYLFELFNNTKNFPFRIDFFIDALKFFKDEEIRCFALKKIKGNRNSDEYFGLLVNNYKAGDEKLLYSFVKKLNTPDKAHSVIWDIVEIYQKNKTKDCRNIMEHLYMNLACGAHRHDLVKILRDNNILSGKIRTEIKYDSYLKTRELA